MPGPLQRIARVAARLTMLAVVLAGSATVPSPTPAAAQALGDVRLIRPSASTASGRPIAFSVAAEVEPGTPYAEIRARLVSPSGSLVYQRTQVFNRVTSATIVADFETGFGGAKLAEGRYPLEIRVRTGSTTGRTGERALNERCFIHDPARPPSPLAVVIRIGCAPSLDPDGRFIDDPAIIDAPLEAAEDVAALQGRVPSARLSLAIPPVMVEQWQRASAPFVTAGADGVREVGESAAVISRHRSGLQRVRDALDDDRLELVTVAYSDPDLRSLAAIGAEEDIIRHFARGRSVLQSALQTAPASGFAPAEGILTPGAAARLGDEGISYAVLFPASLAGARNAVGTWTVRDTTLTALVADTRLSALLGARDATPTAVMDRLFELRESLGATTPIAAVVEVGPGRKADAAIVERFMAEAATSGWLRPVTASEAASAVPRGTLSLAKTAAPSDGAAAGYWREVGSARRAALALQSAAGTSDPDAEAAIWSLLMAESSCWAGPDRSWALADRGRAFVASSERRARAVFDAIRLDVSDLTLSGSRGRIPVVIANDTDKTLLLKLRASPRSLERETEQPLKIAPSENFATISVNLRGAISDDVRISLRAGDLVLSEQVVTVRASVLDRLVIVAFVVVFLLGLLVFVRRRIAEREPSAPERTNAGRIRGGGLGERVAPKRPDREDPSP